MTRAKTPGQFPGLKEAKKKHSKKKKKVTGKKVTEKKTTKGKTTKEVKNTTQKKEVKDYPQTTLRMHPRLIQKIKDVSKALDKNATEFCIEAIEKSVQAHSEIAKNALLERVKELETSM